MSSSLFITLAAIQSFKIYCGLVLALPNGLNLLQVYADFLAFLVTQSRRHLSAQLGGSDPWFSVGDRIEILLTHPNRWGHFEQQFLEDAVVKAKIFPQHSVLARIKFAEESVAAASFCLPIARIRLNVMVRPPIYAQFGTTCP